MQYIESIENLSTVIDLAASPSFDHFAALGSWIENYKYKCDDNSHTNTKLS